MENKKRKYEQRPKMMGKVTKYNKEKGFGFVRCFEDGESYYINQRFVGEELYLVPGSIIEFEIWNSKEDEDKKFAAKILVVEVPEERHNRY